MTTAVGWSLPVGFHHRRVVILGGCHPHHMILLIYSVSAGRSLRGRDLGQQPAAGVLRPSAYWYTYLILQKLGGGQAPDVIDPVPPITTTWEAALSLVLMVPILI